MKQTEMLRALLLLAFAVVVLFGVARPAKAYGLVNKTGAAFWCSTSVGTKPELDCAASGQASYEAYWSRTKGPDASGERRDWDPTVCNGPYGAAPNRQLSCYKTYSWFLRVSDGNGGTTWGYQGKRMGPSTVAYERQMVACPAGSTEIGGQCQCDLGSKPQGNACVPYQCPGGGSYTAATQKDVEVAVPGNVCIQGCSAKPNQIKVAKDGKLYASWPFFYSGDTCGGKANTDGLDVDGNKDWKDAPMACPSGQCPGEFNGQSMCVACSGTKVEGPKETAPDVPADKPGIDGVTGASKKDTQTTCDALSCTTTTTYSNSNGDKVGEKKEEKDKKSFCQENPELQICKEGKWGGACNGGFQCDGDAIQCAMAVEQHRRSCQFYEPPDEAMQAKAASLIDTTPGPAEGAFNDSFSVASLLPAAPSAACGIGNPTVSLGAFSVVMPLGDYMCPHVSMIRSVVVAFGALYFVMIVFVRGD
jgi:hypothetical protein